MSYNLFIDDERFPPNDGREWVIVRSSRDAIEYVQTHGIPDYISYDHDLGGDDTSMRFIMWMVDGYLDGSLESFPVNYTIHSQNPIGARNIAGLLQGFIACEVDK